MSCERSIQTPAITSPDPKPALANGRILKNTYGVILEINGQPQEVQVSSSLRAQFIQALASTLNSDGLGIAEVDIDSQIESSGIYNNAGKLNKILKPHGVRVKTKSIENGSFVYYRLVYMEPVATDPKKSIDQSNGHRPVTDDTEKIVPREEYALTAARRNILQLLDEKIKKDLQDPHEKQSKISINGKERENDIVLSNNQAAVINGEKKKASISVSIQTHANGRAGLKPEQEWGKFAGISDTDLVSKILTGNKDAETILFQRYQRAVYNLAYRFLGNASDAEDAVQETFIRVFNGLGSYQNSRKLGTWLLSIASHWCIDRLRRKKVVSLESLQGVILEQGIDDEPESIVTLREHQVEVQKWLSTIPIKYRLMIVLRYWHEMSYKEIAEVTNLPASTVRMRLYRGRQMLATTFEEGLKTQKNKVRSPENNHHSKQDIA